ncbi:MAG TPA: NADH-quinone oxidoreductase subunit C [Actinomycetota bacterium]|nr:NADH-quinone oxidoreductase subunit C [Actinomycetota bacterium]
MTPAEIAERVRARCPDTVVARGEVTVIVDREDLLETLVWLREDDALGLGFCSSITATDWPGSDPRFWVVYEMLSIEHHHRLRVKLGLAEDDAHVPTVTPLFPTANWLERETHDFYGIVFDGHPDPRPLLLPEGWDGFPLQKTEELGGVNTRFHGAFIPPVDTRTTT